MSVASTLMHKRCGTENLSLARLEQLLEALHAMKRGEFEVNLPVHGGKSN